MKNEKLKTETGFSLVEVLVGLVLIAIVFSGIYGAFVLVLKTATQSKFEATAIALANERMEEIRNLPYKDVGTSGGIPAGAIPQSEAVLRSKQLYVVRTVIIYVDDPFDGLTPIDTLAVDYKRVKISVSWRGWWGGSLTFIGDVAPKGVETIQGGGTLKITVFDAEGLGVAQASLLVVNNSVTPSINVGYQTDDSGNFILAGAPTSTDSYQISVSKSGFNQDRTYSTNEITTPVKPHVSVFESQVTEISFAIDHLSSLTLHTRGQESFYDDFGNTSKIAVSDSIVVEAGEVRLQEAGGDYLSPGFLESVPIQPGILLNWDQLSFTNNKPAMTDVQYHLLFATSGDYSLVPNSDLPGNVNGFDLSPVNLSSLDIHKYYKLKIRGDLLTSNALASPVILDWRLTYNTPIIPEVNFYIQSAKILGHNGSGAAVYKFSKTCQSDGAGGYGLSGLEWDSYLLAATSTTGMDLVEVRPGGSPFNVLPGASPDVTLYFKAQNTLLVRVKDATSSSPIFGAGVRVFNDTLGYSVTKPTDIAGEAFFIPLEAVVYNVEVQAPGYQTASSTASVSGSSVKTITLNQ